MKKCVKCGKVFLANLTKIERAEHKRVCYPTPESMNAKMLFIRKSLSSRLALRTARIRRERGF